MHELDPGPRGAGGLPPRSRERCREPETGEGRDDQVERIGRFAAVGTGIAQRTDQVDELGDRDGVAVGDDQRQRVGLRRPHVQEVDRLTVDRRHELREPVEPALLLAPVELVAPVGHEPFEILLWDAALPA